jgi:hypothetical protein
MNTLMTFATKSHPVRTVMGIVFSISVYMMNFNSYIRKALFAFFSKEFFRSSLPIPFAVGCSIGLKFIVAFFGTKSFTRFMFPRRTFKQLGAFFTGNGTPFFNSISFSKIVMIFSFLFLQRKSVGSIMAQARTKFGGGFETWKNLIGFITPMTCFSYFRHTGIITYG